MTQPIQSTIISYEVTSPDAGPFTVPFRFFLKEDLVVVVGGVATTAFTVTGEKQESGGTVTLVTAAENETVTIYRATLPERETDFPTTGPFRIAKLNDDLDRLTAITQDLDGQVGRSVRGPADEGPLLPLPGVDGRTGRLLAFDEDGDPKVTAYTDAQVAAAIDATGLNLDGAASNTFFTGDGEETDFRLPLSWAGLVSTLTVFVNASGTYQFSDSYTFVDGADLGDPGYTYLRFDDPLPLGVRAEVRLPPGGEAAAEAGASAAAAAASADDAAASEAAAAASALAADTSADLADGFATAAQGSATAAAASAVAADSSADDAAASAAAAAATLASAVVGPALATDGALMLFDGTTGKLAKVGSVPGTMATQNASAVAITGGTAVLTYVQAASSAGLALKNSSGTDVVTVGPGPGTGVSFAGGVNVGGTLAVTGATTLTDDLAVNGGDITTSAATFNLLNTTPTTLNFAGAATALTIGATTGTTAIRNQVSLGGAVGAESLRALASVSYVNWAQIAGGATGVGPTYSVQGANTNVQANYLSKGTGSHVFTTGGGNQFFIADVPSAVNQVRVNGSITGQRVVLTGAGADANVGINVNAKGTESIVFSASSVAQAVISYTASAVNQPLLTGSVAGAGVTYGVSGTDADIDHILGVKGSGVVRFGTFTTLGLEVITGYITIKDAGGTSRKLAVIA